MLLIIKDFQTDDRFSTITKKTMYILKNNSITLCTFLLHLEITIDFFKINSLLGSMTTLKEVNTFFNRD